MTANKFNIGDSVRWLYKNQKFTVIDVSPPQYTLRWVHTDTIYIADSKDLEPWSDKRHCHYCGAEIDFVTHGIPIGMPVMNRTYDRSSHDDNCPLNSERLEFGYNTEQEAIDAYSMKWEG